MPTGRWFGSLTPDSRAGGSLTGSGPATQPKDPALSATWAVSPEANSFGGTPAPSTTNTYSPAAIKSGGRIGDSLWGAAKSVLPNYVTSSPGGTLGLDSLSGVRSLLDSYYGPQTSLLDQQRARQLAAIGQVGVDADRAEALLRRDTDLSRRGLALDRQGISIDQNLTKGQLANLDKLRGILKQQYGLVDEELAVQLAQLGISEAKLKDMSAREIFDLRSNLTSRGAFNTVANDRGTGRINRDLIYGLGEIANQRKLAGIGARGQRLGLDEKGIGYENQGLNLNARLANAGIDLARIGLNEEGLTNSLQDGLDKIGLSSQVSLADIFDAINSTDAQRAQLGQTILGQLLGYSDLPPDALAALVSAFLGGSPSTPARNQGPGYEL